MNSSIVLCVLVFWIYNDLTRAIILDVVSSIARGSHVILGQTEIDIAGRTRNKTDLNLGTNDGLVVTVFDEHSGYQVIEKTFRTHSAVTAWHDLIWWLDRLQTGRIVVIYIRKSGTYGLENALLYLKERGSILIEYLPTHALWIWAWIVGGKTLCETATTIYHANIIKEVYANFIIPIRNFYLKTNLAKDLTSKKLSRLCSSTGGLKRLCSEGVNLLTRYEIQNNNKVFNKYFGTIICAGERFQYLLESLLSLLDCPEVRKENVLVVIGVRHNNRKSIENTISLLQLFQVPYETVDVDTLIKSKILNFNELNFLYYKEVWKISLEYFKEVKYLSFLDEDVVLSKDWMTMMLHGAPLLLEDLTLYCITGTPTNALGKTPGKLYRGKRQVGWGYMLTYENVQEAVSVWPNKADYSSLYDTWLLKVVIKDRECIYPEISYSFHFGIGINTDYFLHEKYFLNGIKSDGSTQEFTPVEDLRIENYELNIYKALKSARPLIKDPCADGFLDVDTNQDWVFYYELEYQGSDPTWVFLAECLGQWPYSTHGMHKGLMCLPISAKNCLWLIGVPISWFAYHMPKNYPVWTTNEENFVEKHENFTKKFFNLPNFSSKTLNNITSWLFPEPRATINLP